MSKLLMNRVLILAGLSLGLGACNYLGGDEGIFRDRIADYQEAQVAPQMQVPDNLDSYTLDQLYVIPNQFSTQAEAFEEVPKPDPIESRRREGVIIQSLADNNWILIDATPGQVWPLVRDYWTQLQIQLDYENPGTGTMDTAWVELESEPENRHKYRVVIEPGLHPGYSEIYVIHHRELRSEPTPVVVNWPELSVDPDNQMRIMRSVSQYLADRNDVYQASSASLLAGSIEAESKASLVLTDSGDQVLRLQLGFNRAWVQVRQALEAAEISIVDSDRDQSVYNVRFAGAAEEVEEAGFIGRLFGGGGDEVAQISEERDFSVRLLQSDSEITVVTEAIGSATLEESDQLTQELLQVINDNLG